MFRHRPTCVFPSESGARRPFSRHGSSRHADGQEGRQLGLSRCWLKKQPWTTVPHRQPPVLASRPIVVAFRMLRTRLLEGGVLGWRIIGRACCVWRCWRAWGCPDLRKTLWHRGTPPHRPSTSGRATIAGTSIPARSGSRRIWATPSWTGRSHAGRPRWSWSTSGTGTTSRIPRSGRRRSFRRRFRPLLAAWRRGGLQVIHAPCAPAGQVAAGLGRPRREAGPGGRAGGARQAGGSSAHWHDARAGRPDCSRR